ncbi:hypothetical protein [Falsiroseomonas ponticola]|jgi:hypothetical protein|uniref:hypothetical protein n=1 Tax=Falsiroseomonas ponticola TaxID=2786951 RepID=UPI00193360D5|nr:hypothetical protein [Roseomonas ponticola]
MMPAGAAAGDGAGFDFVLLPRHGRRPLGFQGRLLARLEAAPPDLPVASSVTLHEAASGGFVCAIRHRLRDAAGAEERCYALAAGDAPTLLRFLHGHDPMADLPPAALVPQAAAAGASRAALAEAASIAPRLRAVWRDLLAASFGPLAHPDHDPGASASRRPAPRGEP